MRADTPLDPSDRAIPRVATLTKDQLWTEIEAGTPDELRSLQDELLAHGYSAEGRAVTRIRERLA